MRILSAPDIHTAVSMTAAIEAVRAGFIALSKGEAVAPVRGVMDTPNGTTLTMPAYINGDTTSVMKLVNVFPNNPAQGLPTIHALVLVTSAETGQPLLLLDGSSVTAIRTGAGSGVATDLLARPDASVLGVIGTGAQARTQIEAVCAVRDIREIRLYSRSNPKRLADEILGKYGAAVTVAESREAALNGADVVVAATNSSTPVVYLADLAPGTHINGVGSFKPDMQEIAADVVTADNVKVVVDHRESAWEEAGDLIIPRNAGQFREDDVYAEIGEVAAGTVPGRESDDEITFFKSVGNAIQDAVMARVVMAALEHNDLGTEVTF
jgi:ornithine cyclodeaminase/alanine dehydrogenase-like protein (mu-crystallin family)